MIGAAALLMFISGACSSTGSTSTSTSETPVVGGTSVTPTPEVVTIPSCDFLPCQGPLEPGTHRAAFYDPSIEFTVREPGWTWYYSGNFRIVADDTPSEGLHSSDGIYVLPDPVAASSNCEESAEPGVGHAVKDLVDWLGHHPGLDLTGRTPVTIGGLRGVQLDLALSPQWTATCPFSEDLPAVPLVMHEADLQNLGGYHWTIVPRASMRWFLLPWKDGVILVDIDNSKGGMSADDLFRAATPIVESFAFSAA